MYGYDPIKLGNYVINYVVKKVNGIEYRRYYRFRGGKWYGGIATGDCVGCNLRCRFCWAWNKGSYQLTTGKFYSPYDVYNQLIKIAYNRKYRYVRLSGAEPTLSKKHLIQVLEQFESSKLYFILETNGILLGYDKDYAYEIASFKRVIIRISIKGTTPEEFHKLTGAIPNAFNYQIKAFENLIDAGLIPGDQVYPAIMLSFSSEENVKKLLKQLSEIDVRLVQNIDPEYVILYPHVIKLMKKFNLKPKEAFTPNNLPNFMI